MKKKLRRKASKKHILKPLSLHPLKAEEALRLFMQADPAKVEAGMRRLWQKRG
jgi:hypothetical protein